MRINPQAHSCNAVSKHRHQLVMSACVPNVSSSRNDRTADALDIASCLVSSLPLSDIELHERCMH